MDEYTKVGCDIILDIDILTSLGLNIKFSWHLFEAYDGTLKRSAAPIVNMGTDEYKFINTVKITSE